MLIEFRVSNYRSIAKEQVLSLVPASKHKEFGENIFTDGNQRALNAIATYGANSSGKSNLLLAISLMDKIVHASAHAASTALLPYDPFLLKQGWGKKPTKLEVTFVINGVRYRYGFSYNQKQILTEWLYRKKKGREVYLFLREKDTIDVSSGLEGKKGLIDTAIEATRDNALFLSFCDMLNVKEAKLIFGWFHKIFVVDGLNTEHHIPATINILEDEKYRDKIKEFLFRLDLGVRDINIEYKDFAAHELPDTMTASTKNKLIGLLSGKKEAIPYAVHPVYDKEGNGSNESISWKLTERESAGTKKAFHISGPVVWALNHGGILIIDEIEAKMHPRITLDIIDTFLNKKTNPNHAQLIFATHDTNILGYSKLRRDQIYFTEKNKWEATEIFALSDFIYLNGKNKERAETNKAKRYIEGRYGAIPMLTKLIPEKIITHG